MQGEEMKRIVTTFIAWRWTMRSGERMKKVLMQTRDKKAFDAFLSRIDKRGIHIQRRKDVIV